MDNPLAVKLKIFSYKYIFLCFLLIKIIRSVLFQKLSDEIKKFRSASAPKTPDSPIKPDEPKRFLFRLDTPPGNLSQQVKLTKSDSFVGIITFNFFVCMI
jgi:hypothetical protein